MTKNAYCPFYNERNKIGDGEIDMRTYYIYWMKEAVCGNFRSETDRILENLKTAFCKENKQIDTVHEKRFTKCIPSRTMKNFFKSMMHSNAYYLYHPDNTTIYLDETTKASIKFEDEKIILHAVGSREVELIWFEQLRKFAPTFFVYEVSGTICGWLSPNKEVKNYV